MVSFVSIFWYNLNGFLHVENVQQLYFFPAKKAPDDPRGVVMALRLGPSHLTTSLNRVSQLCQYAGCVRADLLFFHLAGKISTHGIFRHADMSAYRPKTRMS